MIYTKDDVKRMLIRLRAVIENNSFYYKNDHLPPMVIMKQPVIEAIEEIEKAVS